MLRRSSRSSSWTSGLLRLCSSSWGSRRPTPNSPCADKRRSRPTLTRGGDCNTVAEPERAFESGASMSEVLLSQLAHVELVSPKPQETVDWMIDVLGLEETAREGQSVYLRGWAEWLHSSLVVTEGERSEV